MCTLLSHANRGFYPDSTTCMGIIDFQKLYPDLYNAPDGKAVFITSPRLSYLTISGHGSNIAHEDLQNAMQLLVGVGFSMKCNLKFNPPEWFVDYIMPPMEIIWFNTDKKKSDWKRRLLLPQPAYVTEEMVNKAFEIAKKKNPEQVTAKLSMQHLEEGQCIQTMHTWSYEKIHATISFLRKEAKKEWYALGTEIHEVYINDPRRTIAKKLQTIIRIILKKLPGKASATSRSSTSSPVKKASSKSTPKAKPKTTKKKTPLKKVTAPKKKVIKKPTKKVIKKTPPKKGARPSAKKKTVSVKKRK